jgi:hypothetical protein
MGGRRYHATSHHDNCHTVFLGDDILDGMSQGKAAYKT